MALCHPRGLPQVDEIYKLLDKNSDGHIDLKAQLLHYTELAGGGLTRAHWQELISWWESPERTEGGTDGRLAAAIAMREAKRK